MHCAIWVFLAEIEPARSKLSRAQVRAVSSEPRVERVDSASRGTSAVSSNHCKRVQFLASRCAEVLQRVDALSGLREFPEIGERPIRREIGLDDGAHDKVGAGGRFTHAQ